MARPTAVQPEPTVEETVEPTTEVTVEETPTEVEVPAEGGETETPTEAPAEDAPIDLTEFVAAVASAVENSDSSTGDVPTAEVEKVRSIYQGLDGIKPKNAAKAHLQEQLKTFLTAVNGPSAKAIMQLTEEAAVAGKSGGSTSTAKPVNPTETFVSQVAGLILASYLVQRTVPEGVDGPAAIEQATNQANEAFEQALAVFQSEGQETDVPLIRSAVRLAATKAKRASSARAATGERRDLGAHIAAAFDAADEGDFLTVADIRKFDSGIYPKDNLPSAGAITNRLEPKSGKPTTISGIRVERRSDKLGAVKVGEVTVGEGEGSDES